jgi:uncharacterized protein (TIGR03067 family)
MRRHFLVIVCGLMAGIPGSPVCSAQEDQAVKDALAQIEGTWQLVYSEADGKAVPGERIRNVRVVIKGNTHSVYFDDKPVVHDVRFTLDPTAAPRTIDDTINDGPDKGKQIHGIYEIESDTLASCVAKIGQERPKKFATTPGSGHTLRVFKRVRPNEDPKEKTIREELIRFGGTWRFAEMEIAGEKVPIENFAAYRLILQGDRWLSTDGHETSAGYYKIDPTRVPKIIDVVFTSGTPKGTTARGIYELTDDVYKTCISVGDQSRPEKFESKAASHYALEVLKKEKP